MFGLMQLILCWTCLIYWGTYVIDLIIVNNYSQVSQFGVINVSKSDHQRINCTKWTGITNGPAEMIISTEQLSWPSLLKKREGMR